jgi:superfamily I DNA/RNA helicase
MALTLFNNVSNKTQLNLTLEQQAAVDAPLPTVTLSCAGTGKTTTMIERIKKANEQDGIKLERVFVATFSKYAAQDMTNRLIVRLNNAPQFIGTFHRNCFKLFKKFLLCFIYVWHFNYLTNGRVRSRSSLSVISSRSLLVVPSPNV